MSTYTKQIKSAGKVVSTINVLKWVTIVALTAAGVIVALSIEFGTTLPRFYELVALTAGVLAGAAVWVSFGFKQHSLGMLTVIAANSNSKYGGSAVVTASGVGGSGGVMYGGAGGNGGAGGQATIVGDGGVARGGSGGAAGSVRS